MRSAPIRTCVGCREAVGKQGLVRLYKTSEGEIKIDPNATSEGRGAYLCMKLACVLLAMKKGGFHRAFRSNVQHTDPRNLGRNLIEALQQSAKEELAKGLRSQTPIDFGEALGMTPNEISAWRVVSWLRFAEEVETNLNTLNGKKQGKTQNHKHEG
jgi:uncharacterized protein